MKMKTRFKALFALSVTLVGCGDTLKLQGDYQSQAEEELSIRVGGVGCVVHELAIKGLGITIRQKAYEDLKCAGEPLGVIATSGSFSIGEDLDIAPGAKEMDITINKVTVTSLNKSWGSVLGVDATGDCDVADLKVGEKKDVTGMDCGSLGTYPNKDDIYFTSFSLNDDKLRFTKLPSEALDHVGNAKKSARRNLDLEVTYSRD